MSENKAIFRSAGILSIFIVIFRITGFLRSVLIANIFGTSIAAQAFFVAFKIPNMLRDIMGEGAANAAFVPVFSQYLIHKQREDFNRLVNTLFKILAVVSASISIFGLILASPIVRVMAPGFLNDPEKFRLTVNLTRILFPYLFLITISAFMMSVSNTFKSFAVPASSSIVFNLVLIIAIIIIGKAGLVYPVYALCFAVLFAGVVQVLFQMPSLSKLGVDFAGGGTYGKPFKEEGIKKIGKLIAPRIAGTSIYQINIFIDTIFASLAAFVGEGAIAAIFYANLLIQFPFSVFGVALSNAALPTMSVHAAKKDLNSLNTTLNFSFKTVFICIVPLAAGLMVFSFPLVKAVFERGEFDAYSTLITSKALFFYSFGLLGYVGVRFLSLGFYAMQDTITPVKTATVSLFMNILFNSVFVFIFRLGISGLAIASSISATVNFILLYRLMKKRTGYVFSRDFVRLMVKIFCSSSVMVLAAWFLWRTLFRSGSSFVVMSLIALSGAFMYAGLLWLLDVEELKGVINWLKRKR
ncbi:MAG TPA: murein biosynthesis integral membrane protein MurJ [Candidatus Omnitrophota bacterium]|nr:murein biosynthesis integral membrane protein MurJ [Candidatus Omnitrophota bacterium]